MASTTNPGAIATARMRAQNPGVWNRPSAWPGHVGSTIAGAVCDPECPNLTETGFKGAEWPSAGMPLGDNRLADSDLQTRFTGGLLATNLIQYWEYSRNLTTLREKIYPFVKVRCFFPSAYHRRRSCSALLRPPGGVPSIAACIQAAQHTGAFAPS